MALRLRGPDGGWQLREDYREMQSGHAEALIPMIAELMASSSLSFADLRRIAVTIGPGSFTGVRIGLSAARGLKLALGLPVVTLTSLAVMAYRADTQLEGGHFGVVRKGAALAVCMDARAGRLYAQAFGASVAEPLTAPTLCAPAELAEALAGHRIVAVGSGGALLVEAALAMGGAVVAALPGLQPHARHLAQLADAAPVTERLDPLYLRGTDAKPMAPAGR